MEYLEGESLRSAVDGGRLAIARALHIARQVADALSRVHALGIVHRDLKPDNVMLVRRDDDDAFVKVLDFGIAKVPVDELGTRSGPASKNLTHVGFVFGTPHYMPPEQAIGEEVDGRADLYALGVVLYEMLTGQLPFTDADHTAVLAKHLASPPPPMSSVAPDAGIPSTIESIVSRLLEKSREQRYASANDLVVAIDAAADTEGIELPAQIGRAAFAGEPPRTPRAPVARSAKKLEVPTLGRFAALVPAAARAASRARSFVAGFPGWPRWAKLAVPVAGVGVLALAIGLVARPHADARAGGLVATATSSSGAAPPSPKPLTDADVEAAARVGAPALEGLAEREPEDVRVRRALVKAYAEDGRTADAVRAIRALAKLDPRAGDDRAVVDLVVSAATDPSIASEAFVVLEESLGSQGVDALLELASRPGPARSHAQQSLTKQSVRDRASKAALVVLDLRAAMNCDAKRAILPRAEEHGDLRALPLLRPLTATSGCGFLSLRDCYPCLRRDKALYDAISAIESRRE
jgi:serine/threonine-protein kinase